MFKDYDDKKKAGQVDDWKYLIYVGRFSHSTYSFEGRWYYNGFENNS